MRTFKEILHEETENQKDYREFFRKKLEKYGVDSPSELSDADKKKFYNEIHNEWESKEEKNKND